MLASVTLERALADDPGLVDQLTPAEAMELLYDWTGEVTGIAVGRPEQQMPPLPWRVWLYLSGRGGGKTRSAAEAVRYRVERGMARKVALVGETAADVRDVMVEGESGILRTARPDFRPKYEPSKRRLTWPNGATATTYSADDPEQLRGPEHDFAWCDELAKWRRLAEAWSNLMLGLRLNGPDGTPPGCVATTTPRAVPLVIELARGIRQADGTYKRRPDVALTTSDTFSNAKNLAESFIADIVREYGGTRLGRQELKAEILDEVEGALWTLALIDAYRVAEAPSMHRIVVAVDPPGTEDGAECGIVAAGVARGAFGSVDPTREHGFVLADRSERGKPEAWARRAVNLFEALRADCIVAEVNNGGDMVEHTIRSVAPRVPVKQVRASRGKQTRAEPVSALYEQGLIHHVRSENFAKLEDQMSTWLPGEKSPDRMDALVWAVTELMLDDKPAPRRTSAASPILIDMKG